MTNDARGAADGTPVPNVELLNEIGEGGFGKVYRGRHTALDVDVAVKLIDAGAVPTADRRALLREARLMARLDHPNLLRVFDAGWVDGQLYLVLEFMDGGSCQGLRGAPADEVADVALQLLSGLQALHDARILHRDIKPANCLRRGDRRVKLADLGLAVELSSRAQPALDLAGTIPYMAPELFDSPPGFGLASDLYALGMTLATFVLGSPPCPQGGLSHVLPWIRHGSRPRILDSRPDLPRPLATLVERMISPHLVERPHTVAQALGELAMEPTPSASGREGASEGRTMIGPWVIGDSVYSSTNWDGWAVTHARTGTAGRLMRLTAASPLRDATAIVLSAAERAAQFEDRYLVPVLDWGLWDDRVYVVTAARGRALDELVRAHGPLDEISALRFLRDLAEALAVLHGRGLVYQNVDPGAAVVAYDARSAQLSWPIYCVPAGSDAGQRVLVPRYAAPEALFHAVRTIEPAVDIFGLGALMLFLLTGEAPPRDGRSCASFVREVAPETTAASASLVADLLAARPEHRPTAEAALARIRQVLARLDTEPAP